MKTLLAAALLLSALPALASPAEGYFVTIDDDTDQPRGLVELRTDADGTLTGHLVGSFNPDEDFNGVCITCSDDLKDQPLSGLRFVWGLEDRGEGKYKGGRIQDPESGKTYKSKAKFTDDDTLELRGYVGSPVLGRTQVWRRATPAEVQAVSANLTRYGLAPLQGGT